MRDWLKEHRKRCRCIGNRFELER